MIVPFFTAGALAATGLLGGDPTSSPKAEDPSSGLLSINLADNVTMKLFGRLFIDWGWFSGDDAFGDLHDATEIRTARLGASGTLYDEVNYKVEFDLGPDDGGETAAKDVYIGVKDTPVGEVRVGHFKEPFSLEQLTSSRFITFMERSVADAFVPGRNSGIALLNNNPSETVTWSLGAFRSTDNQAAGSGNAQYRYSARVTAVPMIDESGENLVHVGGSVSYSTDEGARFRAKPESDFLDRPVDTGNLVVDDTTVLGLEGAWVGGPLSVQGEYNLASTSAAAGGTDGDFSGFYGFVSYFLTGEHRNYKRTSGAFDRVKPMENWGAGSGALELAARYSMIDLNDGPSTGEMNDITVGLNWYLNPNSRVQLNWVRSNVEDGSIDDDADILMVRFQVDF
jgi:phosphate-selective porin OprO/OprP